MIALWGVDLPYFDQWELIPRFAKWQAGTFPWGELWQFHNEHRLFVPELIMLLLGRMTDWDIRWELAVNFLLALATFALLYQAVRDRLQVRLGEGAGSLVLPLVSLMIFSPSQWGNWSWGWQIQIFLCILLVVFVVLTLTREHLSPAGFLGAAAGAGVAPFCFANGLLLLPLALPLVLRRPGRFHWRTLTWLAVSGLAIRLYGIQLLRPRFKELNTPSFLDRTLAQLDYFVHYLAGPLLTFHAPSLHAVAYTVVPISLIVALALLWRLARRRQELALAWAALLLFGLASAAMTAYGRYSFGLAQATSSRYFTIANLYWLGLLGLAILALRDAGRPIPRWWTPLLVALALCLTVQGAFGAIGFRSDSFARAYIRAGLRGDVAVEGDPVLLVPYPDKAAVRERLEVMKKLQISVYRE